MTKVTTSTKKLNVEESREMKEPTLSAIEELQKEVELLKRQMRLHQHITISRSGGFQSIRTTGL